MLQTGRNHVGIARRQGLGLQTIYAEAGWCAASRLSFRCRRTRVVSNGSITTGEAMASVTITDIAQGTDNLGIGEGLLDGTLRRHGGVIRHAAGRPEGGRIVAHLQDMGMDPFQELVQTGRPPAVNPPMELGQLLELQSLTAVTSMVNLGVSVAGFAYTAYQLHKVREGIDTLQRLTDRGFKQMDARLDDVARRLEELYILQKADLIFRGLDMGV